MQGHDMALDPGSRAPFLIREEAVLDTWFSSALWPFSTLGWPDETPELKRYYPTDVLVTGFDIIFFWVAPMMMMGLHFMKEAPLHTVYIHALVPVGAGAEAAEASRRFGSIDAGSSVHLSFGIVYCDWSRELSNPVLRGPDGPAKTETQAMVAFVRDQILALLHPFMPFVTEELWSLTAEAGVARERLLALAPWPLLSELEDVAAEAEFGWVVDVITAMRSFRTEMH